MNIILASNNKNKLREIRAMLEPKGIDLLSLDDCGIHIDIKETGKTSKGTEVCA
jgi:XTP/dITP diphosphohydrolase